MTTKQRIAVAVAQGHTAVDGVARQLNLPKPTVLHLVERSELVQVGFGNVLYLVREAAIIREGGTITAGLVDTAFKSNLEE